MKWILIIGGVVAAIAAVFFLRNDRVEWRGLLTEPPPPRAVDPKQNKTSPGYVDACHNAFKAGTAKATSKYGVPDKYVDVGAKINPYYYTCDAGGFIADGAKKLWNKIF